ncbi:hypothetical protein BH10PLA1_BH10PLA1_09660 [soil metagenome]
MVTNSRIMLRSVTPTTYTISNIASVKFERGPELKNEKSDGLLMLIFGGGMASLSGYFMFGQNERSGAGWFVFLFGVLVFLGGLVRVFTDNHRQAWITVTTNAGQEILLWKSKMETALEVFHAVQAAVAEKA